MPKHVAVLRLLLLVLLAFGVAGMHTTGHPSTGHGGASHMAAGTSPMQAASGLAVTMPLSADGFDPVDVCVAILTVVGLAVLVAGAIRALRGVATCAVPMALVVAALGRGPPPQMALGLLLADLSVLRR